jgi:hypothetical protein
VIDLFEETLRFCASGEQLTLKGLFFSSVFDEPAIAAGLTAAMPEESGDIHRLTTAPLNVGTLENFDFILP